MYSNLNSSVTPRYSWWTSMLAGVLEWWNLNNTVHGWFKVPKVNSRLRGWACCFVWGAPKSIETRVNTIHAWKQECKRQNAYTNQLPRIRGLDATSGSEIWNAWKGIRGLIESKTYIWKVAICLSNIPNQIPTWINMLVWRPLGIFGSGTLIKPRHAHPHLGPCNGCRSSSGDACDALVMGTIGIVVTNSNKIILSWDYYSMTPYSIVGQHR